MTFGFFKDKNENSNDENNLSSIFKKIKLNPKVTPNKSLSHDMPDDDMFGQINSYNEPFSAHGGALDDVFSNDNRVIQESTASFASQPNQNSAAFENSPKKEDLFSDINARETPNAQHQENAPDSHAQYQIGPKKAYYTYQSEDAYLDEAGRNSNHLYIGPGEPLTKKKKPEAPKTREQAQYDYFEKARAQENKNITTPPSFASTVKKREDEPKVTKDSMQERIQMQSQSDAQGGQLSNPLNFSNQNTAVVDEEYDKPFVPGRVTNNAFDKKNIFENVRSRAASANADTQDKAVKTEQQKLNIWIKTVLFFRQLISAFFNYTTLGVVFAKTSLRLGPSAPCLMPIAYFAIAFVSALLAVYLHSYAKSSLCANIVTLVLLTAFGGRGFTGIGNLLGTFCKRKIDTYSIVILTIIWILLISSTFEHYLEELKPDYDFALSFASIVMLSAFAGATLNYGDNTDPENSFGSISTLQLLFSLVFYFAVVLVTLDYVVAISMLGIALFSRLVLGQYMYVKGLRASRENVLAVQLITCILLMLDLLFISKSIPSYTGPLLLNIR